MRMWLVDPEIMCRKHLLGEHVECHMIAGSIIKGKNLQGYLDNGLIDVKELRSRHHELALEMNARGYRHNSPLQLFKHPIKYENVGINPDKNFKELMDRCSKCKQRFLNKKRNLKK